MSKPVLHAFAICAYRESPYLEECIRSLVCQSEPGEVILCTSTPSPFLRAMAEKYELPLYVREGESSLEADWNFAVEKAFTETGARLITVAHQDDRYDRNYKKALLHAYSFCPDMSLFCTRYRTINGQGQVIPGQAERVKRLLRLPLRLRSLSDRPFIKRLVLRFGNSIGCPTCTYNLDVTGLPIFRNHYQFVIDWDTLWRLAGEPGKFICIEKELMEYRVHEGAATRANIENHNREREEGEMFRKIWPAPVAALLMHFYKKAYKAYESAD